MKLFKDMKRWKTIIQFIITVLTAIISSFFVQSCGTIDLIVVHCSATRPNQNFPVTALIRCHAERFGFTGYHYYITRNGTTYQTRHEQLIGAHAVGYNSHSLGVCYEGGYDEHGNADDTRTPRQKRALLRLLRRLKKAHPEARILGHRDLPNVHKDCPCFDCSEYSNL